MQAQIRDLESQSAKHAAGWDAGCDLLRSQVDRLHLEEEQGEDASPSTDDILQKLESFFSAPEFTGAIQDFVQDHIETFVFAEEGAEQPLRSIACATPLWFLATSSGLTWMTLQQL